MTMRSKFLASVVLPRFPLAFNPGMPLALPGSQRYSDLIRQLTIAAVAAQDAAGQHEASTTTDDLGKRDDASACMLDYWDLTDDLIGGYKSLKAQGEKYLPKFADEKQSQFDARLNATEYTNIYRDGIESLAGKPFEEAIALVPSKPADKDGKAVDVPDEIKIFADNVDGAGSNLTVFAANTFYNGINSAIDWIWVDYPTVAPERRASMNVAQAKAENIRPFWSHVLGRNVLEATAVLINGKETLIRMRILEPGTPRHIRMFERSIDGVVTWGLFKEVKDGQKITYVLIDSGEITIGVIPLVPFATGRRDGRTYRFYPPMQDAADAALQQYQKQSALKWIKQLSAYPMLAGNGIKPAMAADGKTPVTLAIGPNVVLYAPVDGQGNVGSWAFVQPDAAILTFLAADIDKTFEQLRELVRQPLSAQSANLTVITTAFAAGKSKSAVGAWVTLLKNALENALIITAMWMEIKDFSAEVKIYNDFDDFATDQAADQSALQFMRTNKDLSHQNFIKEQKRRNVIDPDMDDEENDKQLLDETPSEDDTGLEDNPQPKPVKKPTLVK